MLPGVDFSDRTVWSIGAIALAIAAAGWWAFRYFIQGPIDEVKPWDENGNPRPPWD